MTTNTHPGSARPLTVLVVEDDEGLAELMREAIADLGHSPRHVNNGQSARAWLGTQTADLMLLDYSLPDETGAALVTELIQAGIALPPFIVTTGNGDERIAVDMMKRGARDYLVKDAAFLETLPAVIEHILHQLDTEHRLAQAEAEREQAQRALHRSLQRQKELETIINNSQTMAFVWRGEAGWPVEFVSDSVLRLGYQPEDFTSGRVSLTDWLAPVDMDRVTQELHRFTASGQAEFTLEYRVVSRTGTIRWIEHQTWKRAAAPAPYARYESLLIDVTARKQLEEELRYVSTHDALTGLFNRSFFEAETGRLQKGRRYPISVLVADVNDLKKVNDHQGHAAGDALIIHVADILRGEFRGEDIVARLGGDEFAVLLPETSPETLQAIIARVRTRLERHNLAAPQPLHLAIGGATSRSGDDLTEQMRQADNAMYADKARLKRLTVSPSHSLPDPAR